MASIIANIGEWVQRPGHTLCRQRERNVEKNGFLDAGRDHENLVPFGADGGLIAE